MQDIMTEKEAKTKWCPMMRTGDPTTYDLNNNAFEATAKCIASNCMAWRLAHKDAADGTERGYCGAFGTPRFT